MLQSSQDQYDYQNVSYTFTAIRKHLFKDQLYHVHVLPKCITIGEVMKINFHDANPKYVIQFEIKNIIYWKQQNDQERQFGLKYKNKVKYFDANYDHLTKFKQAISCRISFCYLEDFYKIDEQIGKGSFSSVYKVIRNRDRKVFAMKYTQSKQKNNKENLQLILNEINFLLKLNSEQIVKIFEVYKLDDIHYALILEFIEGPCLSMVIEQMKKMKSNWKENDVRVLMQQLLRALNYLHSESILHRDIKPQNIMFINQDLKSIKIIDFGLSIKNQKYYNKCGTPGYMAPEILNMNKEAPRAWDSKCDIFSLGIVFYKLLSRGISCFQGSNTDQVLENNKKCEIDYQYVLSYNYSKHSLDLLKKLLEKDPNARISAAEALRHSYFCDLLPVPIIEVPLTSITNHSTKLGFHKNQDQLKNHNEKDEIYMYDQFEFIQNELDEVEKDKNINSSDFRPSKKSRNDLSTNIQVSKFSIKKQTEKNN